jgi:hypothetical protein
MSARNDKEIVMDFGLSEEQEMIVETVRGFVETEIYPHENEVERTGIVPPDLAVSASTPAISPKRPAAPASTMSPSHWSSANLAAAPWR